MNDRFFLDTNIFVYSFDQTAPAKSRKATQLIRKALTTQKGVISYQVVQEFFNVALKRFSQPMQPPTPNNISALSSARCSACILPRRCMWRHCIFSLKAGCPGTTP